MHALVGVETPVVMAVEFSGSRGEGTHDTHLLQPLVEAGLAEFPLLYLLGDKAYLTGKVPEWLADRGMQAVVPIKKRWFQEGGSHYSKPLMDLVEWPARTKGATFRKSVDCGRKLSVSSR